MIYTRSEGIHGDDNGESGIAPGNGVTGGAVVHGRGWGCIYTGRCIYLEANLPLCTSQLLVNIASPPPLCGSHSLLSRYPVSVCTIVRGDRISGEGKSACID